MSQEMSIESPYSNEELNEMLGVSTPQANNEEPAINREIFIDKASSRFSSAIWYDNIQSKTITVAGIGGIGSNLVYLLARVKPEYLILYDMDKVEEVNMAGQMFSSNQIDSLKTDAIAEMIKQYSSYYSIICKGKFTEESTPTPIMICGFDNMTARKVYFYKWHSLVGSLPAESRKSCLFIDGRLNAEEFQILCIRGDDNYNIERYRKEFLFEDEEVEDTICSYKQTSYCATMIASFMTNLLINFCTNECNPIIERDLPFFTSYNAETMYLKQEM